MDDQRSPEPPPEPAAFWQRNLPPMLFPNEYVWFVFMSAMDIMLTWAILEREGREVNPVAALVIESWGLNGAIAFKFALTVFVIVACEAVGRQRLRLGRWLARFSVGISAVPPAYSLALLTMHVYRVM